MAKLKNQRHEEFCQLYVHSKMRGNAARCYMWVYSPPSYKTALTNGPRLKEKCLLRIIELQEELVKAWGGYGSVDYRRERRKKSKVDSPRENPRSPQPQASPVAPTQAPSKPYKAPIYLRNPEDDSCSERDDPWGDALNPRGGGGGWVQSG